MPKPRRHYRRNPKSRVHTSKNRCNCSDTIGRVFAVESKGTGTTVELRCIADAQYRLEAKYSRGMNARGLA